MREAVMAPATPAGAAGGRPLVFGLPWAPNVITLVRTVGATALAAWAAATSSMTLLAVGYAVYWLGDMADGAVARWRDEKTRQGAVLDIVSDRACATMLATAFIVEQPSTALPLALFLMQFCVLDTMLSLAFLYWPVDSPNDMHLVDTPLYRLNWSPPAKALNTAAVVLLVASASVLPASAGTLPVVGACGVALGVTAVKLWSLRRAVHLLEARTTLPPDVVVGPFAPAAVGVRAGRPDAVVLPTTLSPPVPPRTD